MKTFKLLKDDTIEVKFQFGSTQNDYVTINLTKKEIKQVFEMANKPQSTKFEFFWKLYPKKVSRKPALQAWIRHNCDEKYDEIAKGLKEWMGSDDWSDKKFIPHPATFLNQERWDSPPIQHVPQTRKPWSNVA